MTDNWRRLRSQLYVADDPSWMEDSRYLTSLRDAIQDVYALFHMAPLDPKTHYKALERLLPFEGGDYCPEQQLRLDYCLALTWMGEDAPYKVEHYLANAYKQAEQLNHLASLVDLSMLMGETRKAYINYRAAYDAYSDALVRLQLMAPSDADRHVDAELELDLLLWMAACVWELGQLTTCQRHLDQAYALRPVVESRYSDKEYVLNLALKLAWLDAILARALRAPIRAFEQSKAALNTLVELPLSFNTGRLQVIVADCAMDLAEARLAFDFEVFTPKQRAHILDGLTEEARLIRDYDPKTMLAIARTRLHEARQLAGVCADAIGVELARLTSLRLHQLSAQMSGRSRAAPGFYVEQAKRVAIRAQELNDEPLYGRTLTAQGDALRLEGRTAEARVIYQQACRYFSDFELNGQALWPRRALQSMDD